MHPSEHDTTPLRPDASLRELRSLFSTLDAPGEAILKGFYRACFIGPWWLRKSAPPTLYLTGLPNWQGKRFLSVDRAVNIVLVGGAPTEALSMSVATLPSHLDAKPVAAVQYGAEAPLPWRWVIDELRAIDDHTMLGMTIVCKQLVEHLSFPFLLRRD